MAIGNSGGGRVAFIRYVLALLISALCVIDAAAFSFPVTYMETGTISGSLNGVDFVDAQITITGSGDTANITHGMPCCFANRLGVSTVIFDLTGFGTGTFTDLVGVAVNQTNTGGIPGEPETGISGAGFSDFTSNRLILWTLDPAFASWDLSIDIGPVTGPGFCNCNPAANISFPTSLGLLHISATDPTFTADVAATPAPEPASLALFAIGLGVLGFSVRRRVWTAQVHARVPNA